MQFNILWTMYLQKIYCILEDTLTNGNQTQCTEYSKF